MRPRGVVVDEPGTDEMAGPIEIDEQTLIEKLVAHPTVEGFDVAILRRFAGCDVVPFNSMIFCPAQDGIRGEPRQSAGPGSTKL